MSRNCYLLKIPRVFSMFSECHFLHFYPTRLVYRARLPATNTAHIGRGAGCYNPHDCWRERIESNGTGTFSAERFDNQPCVQQRPRPLGTIMMLYPTIVTKPNGDTIPSRIQKCPNASRMHRSSRRYPHSRAHCRFRCSTIPQS
jgi:hypothetical protein